MRKRKGYERKEREREREREAVGWVTRRRRRGGNEKDGELKSGRERGRVLRRKLGRRWGRRDGKEMIRNGGVKIETLIES